MENPNLEFIIDKDRDSESLDDIRIQLFNCLLNIEKVEIHKSVNFFNNTILLSFLNDNNNICLEKEEKELLLKFLDMFRSSDIYISCDKDFINYMKLIFNPKFFTTLRGKFTYCKGDDLKEEDKFLIKNVINHLNRGIGYYPNREEIENVLNLKNLKKVKIKTIEDIPKIFSGKESSDYYLLADKLDSDNIKNLKESKLPRFEYINDSIASKFYLLRSLTEVGIEDNLPNFTLKKMLYNLEHHHFFETVSYQMYLKTVGMKTGSIKKQDKVIIKKFRDLEKALAFNIKLANNDIHGTMITHRFTFNICYYGEEMEEDEDMVKISKERILTNFSKKEISDYQLENKDLYFLTNVSIVKYNEDERDLVLPEEKTFYTKNGIPVSIESYENRNLYCYNVFNDILKLEKNNYSFDRSQINIDVDIDIEFMEKIDFVYSMVVKNSELDVVLKKDIFIDGDVEMMESKIRKLWRRGYFLTDYAIYRYRIMGTLKNQDIRFPDWFESNDIDSYQWLVTTLNSL